MQSAMHQSVRFFTGQMIAFRASSTQTQTLLISKDPTCYFQDSDYDVHDDVGYGGYDDDDAEEDHPELSYASTSVKARFGFLSLVSRITN